MTDEQASIDANDADIEPVWPSVAPEEVVEVEAAPSVLGCTVASRAQLPAALVARDSFVQAYPHAHFTILLIDQPDACELVDVCTPTDIGVDPAEFGRLAMACTEDQLRAVMRPRLVEWLLRPESAVMCLEPAVQVFGPFDDVLAELTPRRPLALAPRVLHPLPVDGLRPSAADLIEAGTFDPCWFAASDGAQPFLALWVQQVSAEPASAPTFLDRAAAVVDHAVIRDPGTVLSAFNAGQRVLSEAANGGYTLDDHPLRCMNFDGFDPQRPWLFSARFADSPRVLLSQQPLLARLCANYHRALVASGYDSAQGRHPYGFDALPIGTVIPVSLRERYRRACWGQAASGIDADSGESDGNVASPFEPAGQHRDPVEDFLDWACEPDDGTQRSAGACRWTAAVWADEPLLRRDYPDPFGADAAGFREWCAGAGVARNRVPRRAVLARGNEQQLTMVDQLGVAVLGSARLAAFVGQAVRASGLPSAEQPYYPVVIRCESGRAVPDGHYVIDAVAGGGRDGEGVSRDASETWVFSEAARRARRTATQHPVRVLALPIADSGEVDASTRTSARERFAVADEFVIGSVVDLSDADQANVLGLVTAFSLAFERRTDVCLLIRVETGQAHHEQAERLRLATAADPRISLVEQHPYADVVAASDCVASLHRAVVGDGGDLFAFGLLEAAAQGIPVLTSDHGAAAELLGDGAAKLVYCHGGEPDLTAAAANLSALADDPHGTAVFAANARQRLLERHTVAHAGEVLRDQVEQAYRSWRTARSQDKADRYDDPLRPLLVARHALHRAPDVGVGGRNSMAPALRKAVLKALGHYDEHIRDIMRSVVDGVEQTSAELLRRQQSPESEVGPQLSATNDEFAQIKTELADQQQRLRKVEEDSAAASGDGDQRIDALAERLDRLTGAVERTLDRVDELEKRWTESLQEQTQSLQEQDERLATWIRRADNDAGDALRRTDVLQRIRLREHERSSDGDGGLTTPVLCEAGLLRFPADDSLMLPWLSSHSAWDTQTGELIDSLLEPDGVFLDIGSYVGYHAVRVLSRFGNRGTVVAVEPCERSRELLERNIAINVGENPVSRLTVLDKAAWDTNRMLIAQGSLAGGVQVFAAEEDATPDDDTEPQWSVQGARLDHELEGSAVLNDHALSVVHVDVGANAHRILGGLVRFLRRDRPSVVCSFTPAKVEQMGDDPAAALREFGTWGYDLIPVGRSEAVSADDLLQAVGTAGATSTVKLWLRPKGAAA